MTSYYVTRGEGRDFIAVLTLNEIRIQLAADELQADWYATESDGRSFGQFKSGGEGRWRTFEELLAEQPTLAVPVPIAADAPAHGRLMDEYQGGTASSFVLRIGLLTAALGCAATPVVLFVQAFQSGRSVPNPGELLFFLFFICWCLCLHAAVVVVFKRSLTAARIAARQDTLNASLEQELRSLRNRVAKLEAMPGAKPIGGEDQPV